METLLFHASLVNTPVFDGVLEALRQRNVKINVGPRLNTRLPFGGGNVTKDLRKEYSDLECAVEIVTDVEDAIKVGNSCRDPMCVVMSPPLQTRYLPSACFRGALLFLLNWLQHTLKCVGGIGSSPLKLFFYSS